MTTASIDFAENTETMTPTYPVQTATSRSDGMVRVQVVPLVRGGFDAGEETATSPSGSLISQQLIIDYVAALAQHAVKTVRNNADVLTEEDHMHPNDVACLRCAVISSSSARTLATALLEILNRTGADEEWNNSGVSNTQVISRLRRLAVSAADLDELYGEHWPKVVVTALRVEAADLEMVDCLTRDEADSLHVSDYIEDPLVTRKVLAAYQLGSVVCPYESNRVDNVVQLKRFRIARRLAVAMGKVAAGKEVSWIDYLPAPPL